MISGVFLAASVQVLAANKPAKTYYRFVAEGGVKVISQTMPPQYIRNGYEIVTATGEVLKVIPPAPPESQAEMVARQRQEAREQAKIDTQLRRSYSAVADIDGAKARNLAELRNNINILQANILSVKSQLKDQESHAAAIERNGQKVSDEVLKNIQTLRTEEKDITAQIKQREIEFQAASDKFDQDKKRFMEITASRSSSSSSAPK
jgi:hypothetical protein